MMAEKSNQRILETEFLSSSAAQTARNNLLAQVLAIYEPNWGGNWRALILTGSMARREEAWVRENGRGRLLGDAELLAVFDHRGNLPSQGECEQLQQRLALALKRQGLQARVDIGRIRSPNLRRLGSGLFAFELRACGRVVAGDPEVLGRVPAQDAAQIAREDGWRLLANRLLEWLEARWSRDWHYALCKLYVDMGTSRLIFEHACAAGYRERQMRLLRWSKQSGTAWQAWVERVSAATPYKLGERQLPAWRWQELRHHALSDAARLWAWERVQMADPEGNGITYQQLANWYRRLAWRERFRGWLAAARALDVRECRRWPAWICRGWRASPRYWVYAGLERLLNEGKNAPALPPWLPLPAQFGRGWELGLVENYRRLLVTTRS